jgi:pyocin large subunit-like protein
MLARLCVEIPRLQIPENFNVFVRADTDMILSNSLVRNSKPKRALSMFAVCVMLFATPAWSAGQGFRTEHLLQDHFEKHGREFGAITRQQYLHLAQQLRDSHVGKDILESRRPDAIIRFDRRHGYFGIFETDGTIRTFFIPPDGIRFFEREAR